MTFKIINALRIISILILALVFFISYAGLPDQVLVLLDNNSNPVQYLDKNLFFYSGLALLIFTNTIMYMLSVLFNKSNLQRTQSIGNYIMVLIIIINIFFSVALTFIGVLNGQENFNYLSFAPFIYSSLALFVLWGLAFIFSLVKIKKTV